MYNLTNATFAQSDIAAYSELEACHIPVCYLIQAKDNKPAALCGAQASKATICGYFQSPDGQAAVFVRRVADWHILFLKPVDIRDFDCPALRTVRCGSGVIACYAETGGQLEFVSQFLHGGTVCFRIPEAIRENDVKALFARLNIARLGLEPLLKPSSPGIQNSDSEQPAVTH